MRTNDIDYCFHTHTERCGHAYGKDEEYVKAAIDRGFKYLGFSDHVFLPGIYQPHIRGAYSLLDDYKSSILSLKEKYKDQIDIALGFECEYQDNLVEYYKKLKEKHGFDYLILGQHCYFDEKLTPHWYLDLEQSDCAREYCSAIVKGIKSGLFAYVAHPDLFLCCYTEYSDECIKWTHEICKAAEENHVALELNLGRLRGKEVIPMFQRGFQYPYEPFWKIVSQYNIEVVIGVDAHNPSHFVESTWDYVFDLADRLKLQLNRNFRVKK